MASFGVIFVLFRPLNKTLQAFTQVSWYSNAFAVTAHSTEGCGQMVRGLGSNDLQKRLLSVAGVIPQRFERNSLSSLNNISCKFVDENISPLTYEICM